MEKWQQSVNLTPPSAVERSARMGERWFNGNLHHIIVNLHKHAIPPLLRLCGTRKLAAARRSASDARGGVIFLSLSVVKRKNSFEFHNIIFAGGPVSGRSCPSIL